MHFPHIFTAATLFCKCVLAHYICCMKKHDVKTAFTVFTLVVNAKKIWHLLSEQNEQSRANKEITPYLLLHCLWYKCILSPHIYCARKYLTNVFFYVTFACSNKRLVKAAITAFAAIVNTMLNMKFALKQTWSKLSKCGLYAIYATDLLPEKICFFVQWYSSF